MRHVSRVLAGLLAIAAVTAVLRAIPGINSTTVALVFLLIVLGAATLNSLSVAVVLSVAATLALNFFFIPPIGTFVVADPQEWVALVVFLLVAITASNLSTSAHTKAREAIARGHERDAAELARQKAELAATFLTSISHDLKTPLTAIRVAVENLTGDLPASERQTQGGLAVADLDRLTRMIQDVLDMARIDASAVPIERQWVTPADVVDAAMAHVRHTLEHRSVKVDADSESEIDIDPRLASGALAHLLENAVQYSPAHKDIVVIARAEREGLRISVTDHGPGLEPEELEHLFDRFFRGKAARGRAPGTGMGLAITRGLLTAAGGRTWAENVPGGGARFLMTVPGTVRAVSEER